MLSARSILITHEHLLLALTHALPASSGGQKGYILLNAMEGSRTFIDEKFDWEPETAETGFLFVVLSILVLSGGDCKKGTLQLNGRCEVKQVYGREKECAWAHRKILVSWI